ncbi:MAG: ABC transporter permease [Candidatus Vecturithrix sp.]|jgi:simple sugar transport system permease protein|nr:ABC transporter permease [Candidatus Vecturithrix sp.]
MKGKNHILQKIFNKNETYLFLILLTYSILVTAVNSSFLTLENFFDILRSSAGMGILAMGVLVVILSGGIDVSFTAVAISGGYIAVRATMAAGVDNLVLAFLISCAVGVLLGAINGLIISFFRLPTLIATLGTLSVFFGALTTFVGTKSVNAREMPKCFINFGSAKLIHLSNAKGHTYGLSVFVIPLLFAILLTWLLLKYTMLGRGIYALGNNRESALRAGFHLARTQLFIYCYVGFLAGIMGVVYVSEVRWVNPVDLVGQELTVIAAVVIGGAKLTGGSGTILGTILGVAIVRVLHSTLVLLGLSSSWNDFFVGLIILVSVGITSYQNKLKNEKSLTFKT